jgi:hypothetical protein
MVFQFAGTFYIMEPNNIIPARFVALTSSPLLLCRVERLEMPFPAGQRRMLMNSEQLMKIRTNFPSVRHI